MRRRIVAVFGCLALAICSCSDISCCIVSADACAINGTETELESETEDWKEQETEIETEGSTESETETEAEDSTEPGTETKTEDSTEPGTEIETEGSTEPGTETEAEGSTEPGTETETEDSTEPGTETETEGSTEPESESEVIIEPETEPLSDAGLILPEESEPETESSTEPETGEKPVKKKPDGLTYGNTPDSSYYWDASWYIQSDFRFTQVEKEYALVEGGNAVLVYEKPDDAAEAVGAIPYFGILYVLSDADGKDWVYVESGDVRGFVRRSDLAYGGYADEVVDAIGEEVFCKGVMLCEKSENDAFTYTHTTVQEVTAEKRFALLLRSGAIYEYPDEASRMVGEAASGSLVYVLEQAGEGWSFVESGNVRGFVREAGLLAGAAAEGAVLASGEEQIRLATELIRPEDNANCYYTLKSVRAAANDIGSELAAYAAGYVGKLGYVWGGASLTDGADCSGFVQAVYAAYGINIPRTAEMQGSNGEAVASLQDARPGDIIYWSGSPHVGIYLGNGKVVQCSGGRGNTRQNPGRGPTVSDADYRPIASIRRYLIDTGRNREGSCRMEQVGYTKEQLELIWAIVAQEDNGSYEGALAVISSAMNRTESARWRHCGGSALEQLTAAGQYCYSNDNYWRARLGGNVPDYVKQAVDDCLNKGIRNHPYTSFRSRKGRTTGPDAVQIGGNWFFGV